MIDSEIFYFQPKALYMNFRTLHPIPGIHIRSFHTRPKLSEITSDLARPPRRTNLPIVARSNHLYVIRKAHLESRILSFAHGAFLEYELKLN